MPSLVIASIAGVTVELDLNAASTQVIGLILTGLTTKPLRVVLLDDDGVTPLRSITVPQGTGDTTVSLPGGQRRAFLVENVLNTRGESRVMMTRPFYRIEGA